MGKRASSLPLQIGAAAVLGFAGVYGFAGDGGTSISVPNLVSQVTQTGCNIKGNISVNTGERIYHVPGQRYYTETRIDTQHGERWFCTEAEARAAGWRRSKV